MSGPAPIEAGVGSSSGGSGEPGGADAAADSDAADPEAPRTLGIFLTSTPLAADFAKELGTEGAPAAGPAWAFVDTICRTAAGTARLPNAAGYRALLTIVDKTAEFSRFNQLKEAPRATDRWCSISVSARVPSCTPDTAVIFENPPAIQRGPLHSLFVDEYGNVVSSGDRFWSGFYVPPGSTIFQSEALSCEHWSRLDALSADATPAEGGVGSVAATPPGASELVWMGSGRAACSTARLPLLCIEMGI